MGLVAAAAPAVEAVAGRPNGGRRVERIQGGRCCRLRRRRCRHRFRRPSVGRPCRSEVAAEDLLEETSEVEGGQVREDEETCPPATGSEGEQLGQKPDSRQNMAD